MPTKNFTADAIIFARKTKMFEADAIIKPLQPYSGHDTIHGTTHLSGNIDDSSEDVSWIEPIYEGDEISRIDLHVGGSVKYKRKIITDPQTGLISDVEFYVDDVLEFTLSFTYDAEENLIRIDRIET